MADEQPGASGEVETGTVEIGAPDAGGRLDRALADRLGVSRARVRHLLDVGRVSEAGQALAQEGRDIEEGLQAELALEFPDITDTSARLAGF